MVTVMLPLIFQGMCITGLVAGPIGVLSTLRLFSRYITQESKFSHRSVGVNRVRTLTWERSLVTLRKEP